MKKTRKMLSLILALLMIVTIVPITASAETSGICGDNVIWSFDESTNTLTISGIGAMYDYYYGCFEYPWQSHIEYIKKIIIKDGVTKIGEFAFSYCESLVSIIIANSVTTIGYGAFWATTLADITIPESVTTIGEWAFSGTNITSITIPDGVKEFGYWTFSNCPNLTSVTIPNSVTSIGYCAFGWCHSLTDIIIPDSVTTIDNGAFVACTSLTDITIPSSVTSIGGAAFASCERITVDSNNKYYSSDDYGVLFNKDKTILVQYPGENTRKSYTIPNEVTTLYELSFYGCDNLVSLAIPDSVTSIERCAFMGNYGITDIYYSGTEEQWNAISINNEENDTILNATIHYNYHIHDYSTVVTQPTCTEQGYTTYICECGNNYIDNYIDSTGHTDSNGDGYCDIDDIILDPSIECDCNCHKSGIQKFFFDFALFFQKLFDSNKTCGCGIAHY